MYVAHEPCDALVQHCAAWAASQPPQVRSSNWYCACNFGPQPAVVVSPSSAAAHPSMFICGPATPVGSYERAIRGRRADVRKCTLLTARRHAGARLLGERARRQRRRFLRGACAGLFGVRRFPLWDLHRSGELPRARANGRRWRVGRGGDVRDRLEARGVGGGRRLGDFLAVFGWSSSLVSVHPANTESAVSAVNAVNAVNATARATVTMPAMPAVEARGRMSRFRAGCVLGDRRKTRQQTRSVRRAGEGPAGRRVQMSPRRNMRATRAWAR